MLKENILKMIDYHPIFHLATCEGDKPRVRHMFLFRADENGIIFHSSFEKDVCQQILENNNVELCFLDLKSFLQIRISGKAIILNDKSIKDEIVEHPMHAHLKSLKAMIPKEKFYNDFVVFKVIQAQAHLWSIQANYNELLRYDKTIIDLD